MRVHLDVEGCELCEKYDGYTPQPTHLRIFHELTHPGYQWTVDGADDVGHYTVDCWTFDTWEEAVAELPQVARNLMIESWEWRKK